MSGLRFVGSLVLVVQGICTPLTLCANEKAHQCSVEVAAEGRVDETSLRPYLGPTQFAAELDRRANIHTALSRATIEFSRVSTVTRTLSPEFTEAKMRSDLAQSMRYSFGGGGGGGSRGGGIGAIGGGAGTGGFASGPASAGAPGMGAPSIGDGHDGFDPEGGHMGPSVTPPGDSGPSWPSWPTATGPTPPSNSTPLSPPAPHGASPQAPFQQVAPTEKAVAALSNVDSKVASQFSTYLDPKCDKDSVGLLNETARQVHTMAISDAKTAGNLVGLDASYVNESKTVLESCFDHTTSMKNDTFVQSHHLMQMLGTLDLQGIPICTALLIDKGHILTAKHCFLKENSAEPLPKEDLEQMTFVLADLSDAFEVCALNGSNAFGDYHLQEASTDQAVARIAEGATLPVQVEVLPISDLAVASPENAPASSLTPLVEYAFMPSAHLVNPDRYTNGFVKSNDGTCFSVTKNDICAEHYCGAIQGSSGAPIFVRDRTALTLVGVHIGSSTGYEDCPRQFSSANIVVFPSPTIVGGKSH